MTGAHGQVQLQEAGTYQMPVGNEFTAFSSGILMSAWSLMGYDAAAHMIEETISADQAARWSFTLSTGGSFICGLLYLLGLASCIQVRVLCDLSCLGLSLSTLHSLPMHIPVKGASSSPCQIIAREHNTRAHTCHIHMHVLSWPQTHHFSIVVMVTW